MKQSLLDFLKIKLKIDYF